MFKHSYMQKLLITNVAVVLFFLGAAGCQKTAPQDNVSATDFDVTFLEEGQAIVETQCTVCHSIDQSKASPRSDAPPLSTVLANYNPNALADDFREHIDVGHPDMPDFDFTIKQIEGLLAYLNSIQETDVKQN